MVIRNFVYGLCVVLMLGSGCVGIEGEGGNGEVKMPNANFYELIRVFRDINSAYIFNN